jgi:hypothetical protein
MKRYAEQSAKEWQKVRENKQANGTAAELR